jgi:hypothetical protein
LIPEKLHRSPPSVPSKVQSDDAMAYTSVPWKDILSEFERLWALPRPTNKKRFLEVPAALQHQNILEEIGSCHAEAFSNLDKTTSENSLRALLELGGHFQLSKKQLLSLMSDLNSALVEHRLNLMGTAEPVGNARATLNLIQWSIQHLAKFKTEGSKAGHSADTAAIATLEKALQRWAIKRMNSLYLIDQQMLSCPPNGPTVHPKGKRRSLFKQPKSDVELLEKLQEVERLKKSRSRLLKKLEQVGIDPEMPTTFQGANSDAVRLYYSAFDAAKHVSTFFGLAKLLSTFAKQFVSGNPRIGRGFTASDNLVGKTLPALYAKYTGKKLGFSKP